LKKGFIPELDKDGKIDYEKKSTKKIPLSKEIFPLSFSFFKVGDSIILDPTREEEEASDARITFGVSKRDREHMANSCQKKGEMPFTSEEIEKMMEILPKKFEEINKKLKNFL